MQFAFSAVVLVVLLLPGFILFTAYTKGWGRWQIPVKYKSITEQIPIGIVLAGILHSVWILICGRFYSVSLEPVTTLLIGTFKDNAHFEKNVSALNEHSGKVFLYFITLYAFSAGLGYLAHFLVRRLGLDLKYKFFRFNNWWHYSLTGEIVKFSGNGGEIRRIDVFLATIIHHSNKDFLYKGMVDEFYYDNEGNLDYVKLKYAERRLLNGRVYYAIRGEYLILKYAEMTTINLEYILHT